jgi:hypothetical protein
LVERFDSMKEDISDLKWRNFFVIGKDGTREEVIAKYRVYIMNKPELLSLIPC